MTSVRLALCYSSFLILHPWVVFIEGSILLFAVNPLTGDLVGVFSERRSTSTSNGGSNEDLSSNCSVASISTTSSINSSKESSPAPSTFSTPIKNRFVLPQGWESYF